MNRDERVDAYIARAAPFARPILEHIRNRVHTVLPGAEETTKWSAPAYTLDGKILLGMAAFKAHAALNFWRGQELRGSAADPDGMGQFGKLKSLDDLPPTDELDALILKAAELESSAPRLRKPKHAPKPPPEMHPDFAKALDAAAAARQTFDGFPPSCRREYVEWISEAKREETRQKRIAEAIGWLSEGKRRHWKYENC